MLMFAWSTNRAFASDEAVDELVGFLILMPFLLGVYFVPTIVAFARQHQDRWAILVVNLVFGFTGLGWLVSVIWALNAVHRPVGVGASGASGSNVIADDPRLDRSPYLPTPPYTDLARLKELLDKGAIDQAEYDQMKHRLLYGSAR